ncbi:hypothetical protein D3C72_2409150 [compost metagenome]
MEKKVALDIVKSPKGAKALGVFWREFSFFGHDLRKVSGLAASMRCQQAFIAYGGLVFREQFLEEMPVITFFKEFGFKGC